MIADPSEFKTVEIRSADIAENDCDVLLSRPLLRTLVDRDVVASRRTDVELARTPDLLSWILDQLLPLGDPAGGARHREKYGPGRWIDSLYVTGTALGMAFAPWNAVTFTLRRFTLFAIGLACAARGCA
jgi:hypothetical protein